MTDDPHIAVIGPLALACLRGECPPEILWDRIAETGWELPGGLIDREVERYWPAYWPPAPRLRGRAAHAARLIGRLLAALYDPDARPDDRLWACEPIVRHWRECQATAAARPATPPGGAGTCYHEMPR